MNHGKPTRTPAAQKGLDPSRGSSPCFSLRHSSVWRYLPKIFRCLPCCSPSGYHCLTILLLSHHSHKVILNAPRGYPNPHPLSSPHIHTPTHANTYPRFAVPFHYVTCHTSRAPIPRVGSQIMFCE